MTVYGGVEWPSWGRLQGDGHKPLEATHTQPHVRWLVGWDQDSLGKCEKLDQLWLLTFPICSFFILEVYQRRKAKCKWLISFKKCGQQECMMGWTGLRRHSDVRSNDCEHCAALKQKLGWRMYCWISDERTDDSNLDRSAPASSSMLALDWPRFKQIETKLWRNWLYRSFQDVEILSVMPSHVPAAAESAFRQSLQQR